MNKNSKITSWSFQGQDWGDWNNRVYVFFNNNSVIATAHIYYYYSKPHIAVISNIYVSDAFQGERIGSEIMKILSDSIRHFKSFTEIRLWVKRGSWMQKWYERLGFKYLKDKDDNDIWMQKKKP
jgi:N-acetylglutamate synthase-like GNAT family acetyltransferase